MSMLQPNVITRLRYERAAENYLKSLPLEHFMEATAQGYQRKITLESLDLVHAIRPEVQLFNELLVQYPKSEDTIGQVVPDNMVVVHPQPIRARGSYDLVFQPVGPFWVLEYVSNESRRKDYEISFNKYERELKVPYYMLFYPDSLDLSLFRLKEGRYAAVLANEQGRHPIPELEMEVALLGDWVRYWFRGKLLPLPADLLRDLTESNRRLQDADRRAEEANRRAEEATRQAAEADRRAKDAARQTAEADQRTDRERQARQALEQELAQLREQINRP